MYFELNGNMSKFEGCLKIEIHNTKPLLEKVCQYQLQCQIKYQYQLQKQTKYKAEGKNSRNPQETKKQRRLNKTKG